MNRKNTFLCLLSLLATSCGGRSSLFHVPDDTSNSNSWHDMSVTIDVSDISIFPTDTTPLPDNEVSQDLPLEPDTVPWPDISSVCNFKCSVDVTKNTTDCSGAVSEVVLRDQEAAFKVDLSGCSELILTARICDPRDWLLHIGNSPTNDGGSGDAGEFANDSELQINKTSLAVFINQYGQASGISKVALEDSSFVPSSGCVDRTFIVSDGSLATVYPTHSVKSPYIFRMNQPDFEGQPDALLWVGLNRVFFTGYFHRTGSGVRSATFQIR
ncbi:MAG: hypothetical protein V1754_03585 [Pseudomonadota bacterium]